MTRKLHIAAVVLSLCATLAVADEYPFLGYDVNGDEATGQFLYQESNNVRIRLDGEIYDIDANEIGVIIFDNTYTNFPGDQRRISQADPNMVVFKAGGVIFGRVVRAIPNGQILINVPNGGTQSYKMVDVARIYYNARPFFDSVEVTGNNTVEAYADEEEEEEFVEEDTRDNDNRGNKNKNRKNRNKGDNGNKAGNYQALVGGQMFIVMRSGASTYGLMSDINGGPQTIDLRDGRNLNLNQIRMINYVENRAEYPGDNKAIQPGWHTIILRNGGVVTGQVRDYRDNGDWVLADGRTINMSQIARVYF